MTPTLVQMRQNRVKVAFSLNENRKKTQQGKCVIKNWKYQELNSLQDYFYPKSFQHLSPEEGRF